MPTLHIINTSPHLRAGLNSCLRLMAEHDGIIFIEDAVVAVKQDTEVESLLQEKIMAGKCYALKPDLDARGMTPEQVSETVTLVNYEGFVTLTTEFERTQTWN